ncbi:hypothetical protein [Deinococcus sonorensis]|uniref:DUF4123 domain-containing protein n=2 Tax=Deinococcus sonorensis TaxID=309891 RepID=A0AAU7U851_9DEIO
MLSHDWLALAPERTVYADLSTDHYPWSEVYLDLASRTQLAGVLDVRDGDQLGRYIWNGGEVRGAYLSGRGDLPELAALPALLPRGSVSLYQLEPVLAELVWECRHGTFTDVQVPWPEARDLLAGRRYRGVLLSAGGACSFWDDGRLLGGTLPAPNEPVQTVAQQVQFGLEELTQFWSEVLATLATRVPLETNWRTAVTALADEHPCLDPFAREVWLEGSQLRLHPDVPMEEVQAALRDVLPMLLPLPAAQRSAAVADLRQHRLFEAAGLADLPL